MGATPTASTPDANTHYSTVTATLSGDVTPVWQPREIWTLTVDGIPYQFPVPDTGYTPSQQNLTSIAAGLAAAFNNNTTTRDPFNHATANGAQIEIDDTSTTNTHAFSFSITRGSNGVTGVLDIDNANDVASSVLVPVVLPAFQWLVALFPWARQYFTVSDSLGFTAQPEFQLYRPDGQRQQQRAARHRDVPARPAHADCSSTADPGSAQASDPFLEYNFTQPARTRSRSARTSSGTARRRSSASRTRSSPAASRASRPG